MASFRLAFAAFHPGRLSHHGRAGGQRAQQQGRGDLSRVVNESPGLLQYFAEHGVAYGTVLATDAGAPYSDVLNVAVEGGSPFPLGRAATDAVWVTPAS